MRNSHKKFQCSEYDTKYRTENFRQTINMISQDIIRELWMAGAFTTGNGALIDFDSRLDRVVADLMDKFQQIGARAEQEVRAIVIDNLMVHDVAVSFLNFAIDYRKMRLAKGLKSPKKGSFEICTSLADKLGRICRQIKHTERNDPKPDWPDGMTREMMGLMAYVVILIDNLKVDPYKGLIAELKSTISQYSK